MEELDWQILSILYKHKNITKAAQSLFITQPTLTKRLRQIENEWGVQIVIRGMRGVTFTPQGEYLSRQADQMLALFDRIKEQVSRMEEQVSGTLKLGVTDLFSTIVLPDLVKYFKDKYPLVEFELHTGVSKEVYNLVQNQEVHIGFVRGEYDWPDAKHLLFEEKIYIVSKYPVDFKKLPNTPRIHYPTDATFKNAVDAWWAERYDQPPLISMEVDDGDTCKEMALNGLGYAILADRYLWNIPSADMHKYELKDKKNRPILRPTWMFYYKEMEEINTVRAFVEFIKTSSLDVLKSFA